MANTLSSKKANRVSKRKNNINNRVKNSFKSARNEVVKALKLGDSKDIVSKLSTAYSKIDFAVKKGVIKKNAGSRYKSRIAKKVNAPVKK